MPWASGDTVTSDALNYRGNAGPVYNIRDSAFGATMDGSTDDSASINSAISKANSDGGGTVFIPPGTAKCDSAVNILSNVVLSGTGEGSHLRFGNASLEVNALTGTAHITNWGIKDLQVSRASAGGPAVLCTGDGATSNNTGAIRFNIDNLYISSSSGDGLAMQNSYIGVIRNPLIRSCASIGLNVSYDTTSTTVSVNALSVFGGEIQGCNEGVAVQGCAGLGFFGTTIEGNAAGGADLYDNARNVSFAGCYFEQNGTYDIRSGNTATAPLSPSVRDSIFFDSSSSKSWAIQMIRGANAHVATSFFHGYAEGAVLHNPASGGAVTGRVRDLYLSSTPSSVTGADRFFRVDDQESILTSSDVIDFGGIDDGNEEVKTITLTGVVAGDFVMTQTAQNLQGLTLTAQSKANNEVAITIANNTGGTIDLPSATFRTIVYPKANWF